MAQEYGLEQDKIEQSQGQMLVRRFTDDLSGQTTLERATITAQQEQDALAEERHATQMKALYQDQNRDPSISDIDFHEVETARLALQKTCKLLETTEKPSTLAKVGFHRKSARTAANEAMQQYVTHDFSELQSVIENHETKWKGNQAKVSRQFRRLCGTLDAHKKALAIFPSQQSYASVLCGSLSLIVSAAANHDEIATTISETVANIAVKATRVAKILHVVKTQVMRELFSELYAQVFLFYRDALEWYTKSKTSRFIGSFNEKMVARYESAAEQIESCITEMYREANIASLAMLAVVNSTTTELRDEAIRQRQQGPEGVSLVFAGQNMRDMLMAMHKSLCIEQSTSKHDQLQQILPPSSGTHLIAPGFLDRATARSISTQLQDFVTGDEGHSLFGDGKFWLPDVDVSARLGEWMSEDTSSPTLWVSSPETSQNVSTSRAAAMSTVVAAWQSEMPIISHFCERPRFADTPEDRTVEEVGMIGVVYSLIIQLLQFNVENDTFETSEERMSKLDGSDKSWPEALELFSELLKATPHLSVCIIDGLNDLAFSTGAEWCGAFLGALFKHQRSRSGLFKVLITTSGQSRVLPDCVGVNDRIYAQRGAREVIRNGRWISPTEKAGSDV